MTVLDTNGVIWLTICCDPHDMEKQVVTTQQKKGYSQLLKYLFSIATVGIVSQENCIYATDTFSDK